MILPVVLFALALFSQDSTPHQNAQATADTKLAYPDGQFWKSSSESMKRGYVLGYNNAVEIMFFSLGLTRLPFDQFKVYRDKYLAGLTSSEMVSALDRFYETPENGRIQVWAAIQVIAARTRGADETTVQKMIEDFRARQR